MRSHKPLLGVGLYVASTACWASMGAFVKLAGEAGVPVFEIMFFRSIIGLAPLLIYVWRGPGWSALATRRPLAHMVRSGCGLLGMFFGFSALQHLGLAEATTFQFAAPLFITSLSFLVLREAVGPHRWSAVAAGFLGVAIVLQPDPERVSAIGAMFGLMQAAAFAGSVLIIRTISDTEESAAIVFYYAIAAVALSGACALPVWIAPDLATFGLLAGVGVFGGLGQLLMTLATRAAGPAVTAPFDFTQLLWAMALAALIWQQYPHARTLIGAAVIALSGLYVLHREWEKKKKPGASE